MSHAAPGQPKQPSADIERLRRLFRLFAATQCRGRSPVYEILSEAVAEDEALLRLMLAAPDDQRRPSLLFAAVNRLLATEPGAPLAAYYPTHGGGRAPDAGMWPAFAGFCATHRDALAGLLRERATQTNEIRRCVALRLGLAQVARAWPGPLALVEVGASAGLNLRFDRYRYRLDGREAGGPAASAVEVACDLRGPLAQDALATPAITTRLGIDQSPIDLADPEARAWLEAFVWPEQSAELASLRGAMAIARATPEAALVRGDATADTARLLAALPGDEPVAVFTASLLSYLDVAARRAFKAQLQAAARRRPVAWVFAENPGLLGGAGLAIPALAGPLARDTAHYAIGVSLSGPDRPAGEAGDRLLGLADPYLRWLAPARGDNDDFQWLQRGPGAPA